MVVSKLSAEDYVCDFSFSQINCIQILVIRKKEILKKQEYQTP